MIPRNIVLNYTSLTPRLFVIVKIFVILSSMPGTLYLMPLFPIVLLLYLNVICNRLIFLLYRFVPTTCNSCSCFVLGASVNTGPPGLMCCLTLFYVDEYIFLNLFFTTTNYRPVQYAFTVSFTIMTTCYIKMYWNVLEMK